MKNFIYIAGMFVVAFSSINFLQDSGKILLTEKNTITEQISSTTNEGLDNYHEPILRPTKP